MSIHRSRLGRFSAVASGFGLISSISFAADAPAGQKITYQDHIRPLLENKCFSCHNPDKKKGDLDLTSFAALMAGGGGGAVVDPGNPAGSRMVTTTTKKEEPYMPPEGDPLPSKDIELLSKWIAGGVLETASSVAKVSNKPKISMEVAVTGKPEGPVARPEHVLLEPVVVTPRTTAVTAMGASPWAPLVAMAGQKQILLYDTDTRQLAGIYPYPEGYARSVKFSRNGSVLIVGGGRGGKFGHAVVWDVKTGRRITEVGKEFDSVMCADISPNQKLIAIASPSKKIKVYDTATGEEQYVISKHTDWGMGCAFSPDGVLLATCDRGGNVMVWEADGGGEFFILGQHKAMCNDLAWRGDGNVLASCSSDGTVILWEMNEGKQLKSWAAHSGGVQSVSFTPDGKLLTCGNDGLTRLWAADGKQLGEIKSQGDVVTKVVALSDGKTAATANFRGEVKVWNLENFSEKGDLSSNPPQIAQRIIEAEKKGTELVAQLPAVEAEIKKAQDAVAAKEAQVAAAKKNAADAQTNLNKLQAEINETPAKVAALEKTVKDTQTARAAAVEAAKKFEQVAAQMKLLEKSLADLNGEKAKLTAPEQAPKLAEVTNKITDATAQLDGLKKANASAPKPVAEFDKAIKDAQAQIAALNAAKPAKAKEVENLKKSIPNLPKAIADAEKQLADTKPQIAFAQAKVADHKAQIAIYQKLPIQLKAAQFNVGVLAEKEKLAKLEGDIASFTAAQKENEEGKVASAARIVSSKKAIADATAALPGKEAALKKLQGELAVIEKNYEPVKAADSVATAKLNEQKNAIAAKETEIAALAKAKDEGIAAARKASDDINKQIGVLKGQLADVNKKAAEPIKASDQKKAAIAAAETALNAAKQTAEAAKKKAADARAAAEAPLAKAKADAAAATKELAATKAVAIGKPDMAAKVAAEQQKVEATTKAVAAAQKIFDAAKASLQQADAAATTAAKPIAEKEKMLAAARQALEAAEKTAAPLRAQQQKLQASIDAQQKALAEKQAAPAAIEKDTAAKTQVITAAISQIKAGLPALEKTLADAHAKLEAETKIVDAKRAEVGKAMADFDGTKKSKTDAEAAIVAAEKDIPKRDQAVAECKTELAKLQPQLEPLRAKVKQLTDQYLTMLPK